MSTLAASTTPGVPEGLSCAGQTEALDLWDMRSWDGADGCVPRDLLLCLLELLWTQGRVPGPCCVPDLGLWMAAGFSAQREESPGAGLGLVGLGSGKETVCL